MQKTLRFFLQPRNRYSIDRLPNRRVTSADHAWLAYTFMGDDEDVRTFVAELSTELQDYHDIWPGIFLRQVPACDKFGLIYIVDCNPTFHSSVAEPKRQFDRLVNHLGGERIVNEQ